MTSVDLSIVYRRTKNRALVSYYNVVLLLFRITVFSWSGESDMTWAFTYCNSNRVERLLQLFLPPVLLAIALFDRNLYSIGWTWREATRLANVGAVGAVGSSELLVAVLFGTRLFACALVLIGLFMVHTYLGNTSPHICCSIESFSIFVWARSYSADGGHLMPLFFFSSAIRNGVSAAFVRRGPCKAVPLVGDW